MLERAYRKGNPLALLMGKYGEQHGGSIKELRPELAYDPAIPLTGRYSGKTVAQRDMHLNAHCSSIHNCQDMKAT